MSEPLVSFVINAYNTERYVGDCLRSIFAQEDAPDFEIVLIDDCSTDGTKEAVQAFSDPRLIYLRNETNLNAAASVNIAMAKARGQYIARIDSDDEYRPYFLKRTLPLLMQNPNVGLVYGDVQFMFEDGKLQEAYANVGKRREGRPAISRELVPLLFDNFTPAATMIARREAWNDTFPVPAGRNFCDWYWVLNMARRWDFAFVDEVLSNYRLHPGNMHKAMVREKYGETITFLNLTEIFEKEHFGDRHETLKKEVFATHYAVIGQKYFGIGMMEDARRCLGEALRLQPSWIFKRKDLARWWLTSFLSPDLYARIKQTLKIKQA